jgi:hypothetical protein
MDYLFFIVALLAGILGAAALIVAKRPDARHVIDSLVPFQALIGLGALLLAVVSVLRWGPGEMVKMARSYPLMGASGWACVIGSILLGVVFAVPLMGRLGAGQQRAAELAQKVAPFQILIGLVLIVAALLAILFRAGILNPNVP